MLLMFISANIISLLCFTVSALNLIIASWRALYRLFLFVNHSENCDLIAGHFNKVGDRPDFSIRYRLSILYSGGCREMQR